MRLSVILALVWFGFFIGAAAHEYDMKRNCEKTGNAKAWFVDISCK